ncbi:MAG: flagellar hook-associated protein FlgL [Candidatus Marinimicrobia bacterium]|nr:flagellar hook-associated protein FlgL [Candidatus Neomarinimicrobiota bacterium]
MRVTTNMIQAQILDSLTANQSRLFETQRQISTAKAVRTSSDDPTRYDRASRFKSLLMRNDQYIVNIEDGLGWLNTAGAALGSMHQLMQQINDEGLRSRNDINAAARAQAASSIESLLEQLVTLGNTDYSGKFVFGGTITQGADPFSFDGVTVSFNGNSKDISRKVGENTIMAINVTGDTFLTALAATVDLRDALLADDDTAIDAAIGAIASGMDDILTASSIEGSASRRLELTKDNLQVASINLKSYISQAEDVDLSEAILRFNSQELGLRAALESSSRIQRISILDFIR